MEYRYNDLSYKRRDITSDTAVYVVSDNLPETAEERAEFEKKTQAYKLGEIAAQSNSCPIVNLSHLRERIDYLKETIDGFRIRNSILTGIISLNKELTDLDEDIAAFLIAAGSAAIIARGYDNKTKEILLANGILPLISEEEISKDSLILIQNLKDFDHISAWKTLSDRIEKINIRI